MSPVQNTKTILVIEFAATSALSCCSVLIQSLSTFKVQGTGDFGAFIGLLNSLLVLLLLLLLLLSDIMYMANKFKQYQKLYSEKEVILLPRLPQAVWFVGCSGPCHQSVVCPPRGIVCMLSKNELAQAFLSL